MTVAEADRLIGRYLDFLQQASGPHSIPGARTPADAYFNPLMPVAIAA
jgi:hypothetical protein